MIETVSRFQTLLWSVGSGFHDATLENLAVNLVEASLSLRLRFSKATSERKDDHEYRGQLHFSGARAVEILSPGHTFPEAALVDGIDAAVIAQNDGAAFTLSGTYGWKINWVASDFSYSEEKR